jgi:hypothetical protein
MAVWRNYCTTRRNFIAIKRPAQVLFAVELKLFIYSRLVRARSLLVFYFVRLSALGNRQRRRRSRFVT